MSALSLVRRRLHNHQLAQAQFASPAEVVRWMGAVQAQDYLGALWAVGLRSPAGLEKDVQQSIAKKNIVRTWLMRGTLHFVEARDVRWMLELLSGRIIAGNARRYQELGLDDQTFAQSNEVLAKTLHASRPRSRTDLLGVLRGHGISTDGQRAPYLLQRAALEGLICQGVTHRNVPMYYELKTLPKSKSLTREEALAELATRYFQSRGPATLHDFGWWSGLIHRDAMMGLSLIQNQLEVYQSEGQTYWYMPNKDNSSSAIAHLLPAFDEYLVGYKDRSAVLNALYVQKVNAGGGMLSPVIVYRGQVIATWKRTLKKDAVIIELQRFIPFGKNYQRAISDAVERYSSFIGALTVVVI